MDDLSNQDPTNSSHSSFRFIIWLDTVGSDPMSVEALAYESDETEKTEPPPVGVGDFVIICDEIQKLEWFGQILSPQLNLPLLGVSRDNPSNLAALERVLRGLVSVTVFTRQVYYYQIRLLGQIEDNTLLALRIRPRAGSKGRLAEENEVITYLQLPAVIEEGAVNESA